MQTSEQQAQRERKSIIQKALVFTRRAKELMIKERVHGKLVNHNHPVRFNCSRVFEENIRISHLSCLFCCCNSLRSQGPLRELTASGMHSFAVLTSTTVTVWPP